MPMFGGGCGGGGMPSLGGGGCGGGGMPMFGFGGGGGGMGPMSGGGGCGYGDGGASALGDFKKKRRVEALRYVGTEGVDPLELARERMNANMEAAKAGKGSDVPQTDKAAKKTIKAWAKKRRRKTKTKKTTTKKKMKTRKKKTNPRKTRKRKTKMKKRNRRSQWKKLLPMSEH